MEDKKTHNGQKSRTIGGLWKKKMNEDLNKKETNSNLHQAYENLTVINYQSHKDHCGVSMQVNDWVCRHVCARYIQDFT